jgi:hypothetical protein
VQINGSTTAAINKRIAVQDLTNFKYIVLVLTLQLRNSCALDQLD